MKITEEMVDYTAMLSRLEIAPQEKEEVREKMEQIVGYMDTLQQVDTTGVEPVSHLFPVHNVLREDVVQESSPRDDILKNAPVSDQGTFLVPKAVE